MSDFDPEGYDQPAWIPNELSEVLIGRWEIETVAASDRWVRDAVRFAIHQLITDPDLIDLLDRMQAGGGAA